MAIDKAVDSALLDGALGATADAIRGKTGDEAMIPWNMETGFAAAVDAILTGGGVSDGYVVIEGTITPVTESQSLRIPWSKNTLPLFFMVIRQDFDTYVTPDSPATGAVNGGVFCLPSGFVRVSQTSTLQYISIRISATTGYTGYIVSMSPINEEILTIDGLNAYINSALYKWKPDTTYKYYIIDKEVA